MPIQPWSLRDETTVELHARRRVACRSYETSSGPVDVAVKLEGRVVTVFPVTLDGAVLMCRQFRPGPGKVLDELPAGGVDDGESPLEAARRELREETGYEAASWTLLGTPLECAYSTIHRHAFLAAGCIRAGDQRLDQGEEIEVVKKSMVDVLRQAIDGSLTDPEVAWMGLWRSGVIACKTDVGSMVCGDS